MRPSQRVLQVPELAALICSFGTVSDCARLLRTSRTLFDVAIPSVWEHVNGVQHLLGLISTCEIVFDSYSNAPLLITIGFVPILGEAGPFSRFDFYAPHVRSLDVHGSQRNAFKVSDWSQLIRRSRQKPLLPTLRSLIIGTPVENAWDPRHSPDQLMWTVAFASPSLTTLSIPLVEAHKPPLISCYAASAILETLTQHHSDLQELSLFPNSGLDHDQSDGENSLPAFVSDEPFYHHLVGANNLRHLSGTMTWLRQEPLLVLSKLPLLESITTCSTFDPPDWGDETQVFEAFGTPKDLFPSLRRFSMHETDPLSMVQVLGTRHMFQYITLLELDFNVDDYSIEPLDMWMITTFFPVLSNMPHLCNFSLKILRLYETLTVIKPPVLEILSALPLQSVTLGTMECPLSPWPDNFEIAWSLVTKLSMPNQALSLDFLHHFAALPKLEYLELKLDVQWLFAPTIPEPGPRAPLHTLVSTYNEPEDRNFSSAYRIAQWLLSHWPNLSRMVCPDPIPTDDPVGTLNCEYFDLLNQRLSELRTLEHASEETRNLRPLPFLSTL